jgi:hypothetical protein
MRVSIVAPTLCAVFSLSCFVNSGHAQEARNARIASANPAVQQPKFAFILFWKENNAPTQAMSRGLEASIVKRSQRAQYSAVNVNDPANRTVVDRYQVSRAPMPLVLCVAPNGAITGSIQRQFSDDAVERLIVTPAMADVTKALQDKKIAVIHIKQDSQSPLPYAALEFTGDPMFKERTTIVPVVFSDPAETRFMTDLQIKATEVNGSLLVVFAPPSVVVGKFPAAATKDQIATALHAAGKCCNDANCKHNQKGNTQ